MIETFLELKNLSQNNFLPDFILKNQADETSMAKEELISRVETIADSMIESVNSGLKSPKISNSGLSGGNTSLILNFNEENILSPFMKKGILYALAVIEENASMGKIAACPTAGSSGIVPGVLIAAYEEFKKTKTDLINSLIVSGEIGRIISLKMPLAGAVAGCQAECGVASAMAAGGFAFMLGYDINTIFNAVSLALKNVLGLTCDPVAGLVEIPCVKRNAFLASHAITSVFLAASGVKSCIPLDDIVDAMRETGELMSPKLKESSEAGLAVTKTGILIKEKLYKNRNN